MTRAEIDARMERQSARLDAWWGLGQMEFRQVLACLPDEPREVLEDLAFFISFMMNSHGFYQLEVEDAFEETDSGVILAALGAALGLDPFYGMTFNRHVEKVRYYRDLAWSRILARRRPPDEEKRREVGN